MGRDPFREADWAWRSPLVPKTSADTDGEVARVLGKIEANGDPLLILRLVANAPTLFRPFVLLANALVNRATLPADVREAVILHLAARDDAAYEWAAHEQAALDAGLSADDVAALAAGRTDGLEAGIRLALACAESALGADGLDDQLWDDAVSRWGLEGAVELVCTAAWWGGFVPTVAAGLGLVPRPEG